MTKSDFLNPLEMAQNAMSSDHGLDHDTEHTISAELFAITAHTVNRDDYMVAGSSGK